MKKLSIIEQFHPYCPHCHQPLMITSKLAEAKGLRISSGIIFALAVLFFLPALIRSINGQFSTCWPTFLLVFALLIIAGIQWLKAISFEAKEHFFGYCHNCKKEWLFEE